MRILLHLCCALVLGAPAAASAQQARSPASKPAPADPARFRALFEQGIAQSPGGPIFASIKVNFPADYARMIDEMIPRVQQNIDDHAALRQIGFEATQKLFLRKVPDLVNAPAATLLELNRRQLAFTRNLQGDDVRACAEYSMSGFGAETQLSAAREAELTAIGAFTIGTAKAGADRARDASRAALDPQAAALWYGRVTEIEPSAEMKALLSDEALLAKATPEQQCRLGIAIYAAIAAMPEEAGANVAAFLHAESAKQRSR